MLRRHLFVTGIILIVSSTTALGESDWPPAPPLASQAFARDVFPLPPSVAASAVGDEIWSCSFQFSPETDVESIAVVGTFNGWEADQNPMIGPDERGAWTAHIRVDAGVHEYKFVVDQETWLDDPANQDRVPDGFGDFNSVIRLGQLARMKQSDATTGDGKIDPVGLAHRPPRALYIQPVGGDQVSIRYRTFARDVKDVWLAIRGQDQIPMRVVSEGPLFTFYEATVGIPAGTNSRSPKVRSFEYTFVLDDGGERVGDPHTYRYSFTESSLFDAPNWAKDAIWYQIMLDRFRNGDTSNDPDPVRPWTSEWFTPSDWEGQDGQTFYRNFVFDRTYGGDLAGLEEKLPYLKELGVNAIYLTPIFQGPSYHKYDVANYLHIDERFGVKNDYEKVAAQEDLLDPSTWQWTDSDKRFLAFLDKAHSMGFKVIIDAVFNHVGVDHPAFKDVQKNSRRSRYADWFHVTSWQPFAYKGWAGFAHMPEFKKRRYGYASPDLKQHLFDVTRRWMDPNGDGDPSDGIDGWRLDVPDEIPHPFWAEWRRLVKGINRDALITGEVWNRAEDWLDGRHFDAVMNYEFAKAAVSWIFDRKTAIGATELESRFAELRLAYPTESTHIVQNLIDSHDTDRLVSMAANPDRIYDRQNRVQDNNPEYDNNKPDPESYARARLAALLQMTYVGTPMIYYGDEVGMWGADDPSSRKPMLWKDLEPYDEPEENHVMDEQLAFYKQAIALRNNHRALRSGNIRTLLTDNDANTWAFMRANDDEQLIVVLNASNEPQSLNVPTPQGAPSNWQIVFGGEGSVTATDQAVALEVAPISGVVLQAATN